MFGWKLLLLSSLGALVTGDGINHVELYNQALSLLSAVPQFVNQQNINNDNQVIMSVPMDYTIEYQIALNEEITANLSSDKLLAYELLKESSELGNIEASYLLGDINLYGNYTYPKNGTEALKYYKRVTEIEPNATAYFNTGFIYSTGLFGEIEIDQAKANLYYNFAFNQGDLRAGMVLGYRFLNGISVKTDCERSEFYYQSVADRLRDFYDSSPLGGPHLDSYSLRLSDFKDGVYGKGVDGLKSSLTRRNNRYDYLLSGSYSGNEDPIFDSLYWMLINEYEGSYLKKRNFTNALNDATYVREHALKLKNMIEIDKKYAARCIYILGKLYLRGEGVQTDYEKALEYFKESTEFYPLSEVYNEMGLIYEFGPDSMYDNEKAGKCYKKATKSANGIYNYGRWLMNKGNQTGIDYIEVASTYRDLEAIYTLNELNSANDKVSCSNSVSMLKFFIEKFDPIVTSLEWSFFEMIYNRPDNALVGYAMAAEQGFESAQSSAAYLLYQLPDLFEEMPTITTKERLEMAIAYLTRSSLSSNIESACVLGDIYCEMQDYEKASAAYDLAATKRSSQAHFNLGWLHEHGFGNKMDFNMAKRHYDLALSHNSKAYLIVKLALLKLRFKSFINDITGGTVNGISKDDEISSKLSGWAAWVDIYKKVRNSGPVNQEQVIENEEFEDSEVDFGEFDDIIVLCLIMLVLASFILVHYLNRRRLNQVGNQPNADNNNNDNRGGFNFEVNIIAI